MTNRVFFRHNSIDIPIKIQRSGRKTLSIAVHSKNHIIVKSPIYIRDIEIHQFIDKSSQWISNRLEDLVKNQPDFSFNQGSTVPYMGKLITIRNGEKTFLSDNVLHIKEVNIEDELKKWYISQARRVITDRVNYYTDKLGIKYNKVFIKSQKTRWGSCSALGNLNFNWKIILTSPELIDYLVIHEVCHLLEMNHSGRFWKLVASLDPEHIKHRKELMEYSSYLRNYLQ